MRPLLEGEVVAMQRLYPPEFRQRALCLVRSVWPVPEVSGLLGSPSRACTAGRSRTSSTGASSSGPAGPGPSAAVLLKIYAHCIDGQADAANQRITDALGTRDTQPRPGDEEDGDSKKAS
jgi:hypothetical protein